MVSVMDARPPSKGESSGEVTATSTPSTTRQTSAQSVVSQKSIDLQMGGGGGVEAELVKKTMKLELTRNHNSKSIDGHGTELNKKMVKSPKSPLTNQAGARIVTHQSSITSQIDVVEDRKALREALYQGIFSRHRRTIFAFGSFLRMLRSRNSQYNTIRSSSEGEDDGR